jgi:8-oxo-dGTP diphosphatase
MKLLARLRRLINRQMREPIRKLEDRAEPTVNKPLRLVVAALILRGRRATGRRVEVLICQRKADQPMSLKWEFRGKIEDGEAPRWPWRAS